MQESAPRDATEAHAGYEVIITRDEDNVMSIVIGAAMLPVPFSIDASDRAADLAVRLANEVTPHRWNAHHVVRFADGTMEVQVRHA